MLSVYGNVPLLDKGSGILKSHLRPTTENFAFFGINGWSVIHLHIHFQAAILLISLTSFALDPLFPTVSGSLRPEPSNGHPLRVDLLSVLLGTPWSRSLEVT